MKGSSLSSGPSVLVCPFCERGWLQPSGQDSVHCDSCSGVLSGAMLQTFRQIAALPDVTGSHACEECGHPEMRLLPDGVFHCPACGSEVLPINAPCALSSPDGHSEAYRAGWMDGRFGERSSFADNPNLTRWEAPSDRLDYYRGNRAGNEARRVSDGSNSDTREKLSG